MAVVFLLLLLSSRARLRLGLTADEVSPLSMVLMLSVGKLSDVLVAMFCVEIVGGRIGDLATGSVTVTVVDVFAIVDGTEARSILN